MENFSFTNWCRIACQDIVLTPDRKIVAQELREHMEDHYDALIAKGHSHEEATKMTTQAMGDPHIVAGLLAEAHHPFWGYLLRSIRVAIVILLVVLAIPGWKFLCAQDFNSFHAAALDETYYSTDGFSIVCQAPTGASFTDSNYTYTLTRAVLWENDEGQRLHFDIEQFGLIPCTVTEHYSKYISPADAFWGIDNLGNYYGSSNSRASELVINTWRSQKGIFTWRLECWINDFPAGVQWIDIHYDRDGRDHVIRIFLEGGSSK
jgi:hypothetical protein